MTMTHYNEDIVKQEIEELKRLSVEFSEFYDFDLNDNEISLKISKKLAENKEMKYVPAYVFDICLQNERIGLCDIRIGYNEGIYYGGNIGYQVDEKFRGNGYAVRAVKLLFEVARKHKMTEIHISNSLDNIGSVRVCQKLGAKLHRIVELPLDNNMRVEDNEVYKNLFIVKVD